MMTECYFCKGRVEQQKVDVDFRWGRKLKVIEDVPAGVCQQCGEKYFEASVYSVLPVSVRDIPLGSNLQ
jgi:YgiT-type zinc finger domain-containing protein